MSDFRFPYGGSLSIRNVVLKASFNSNDLNFLHINPGSLKPHLDELRSLIKNVNVHLIAVSETWFSSKHNDILISIPGFSVLRHDRANKRGGGIAIYVKNGIKCRIIEKSNPRANVEFMAIEIDNRCGEKIAAAVVYNPPSNTRLEPLKRFLNDVSIKYINCFFVGDFNLNLSSNSAPVRRFKEFLSSIDLHCPSEEPTNFVPEKILRN